nr:putative tRNA pseudouridine synthase Pus10 isoform X1 [Tanacetum cinerariifolium]
VCVRCIFRLFNVHEGIYAMVSPNNLYSVIEKAANAGETATKSSGETEDVKSLNSPQESKGQSNICSICLGVLQYNYHDENNINM